ncbi:beta-phosphoglucomutase family hydrolase [Euzebya tangerina]|uniref:beta-phosphoglucomutase family hydrolase n=1 Tax=Euzebya tangerina TaxID=591198 RepID=UPI000E310C49|nr:beta-phosphoglucomutase family hydrolase [Euzebya tangerina]
MSDHPAETVPAIPASEYDAVLYDLDGVLTDTASLHAQAWKQMFDEFLRRYAADHDIPFEPFEIATDYRSYVDGKPRYEGVSAFLESRRIVLPEGSIDDPPEADTTYGLGNRKNEVVQKLIQEGVDVYETSLRLVRILLDAGVRAAVVSSSRNARPVLDTVGIADLFEVVVDGVTAAEDDIPGKPEPDMFLAAAERLGVEPARTVVVEDAIAGVEAGHGGEFGLVIGVNREDDHGENAVALRNHGADIVVDDLGELLQPAENPTGSEAGGSAATA